MTRSSLALTLAVISLPVLAASTIGAKCDSERTQSVAETVVTIDTRIDSESLKVLRADADQSATGKKLDGLINSNFEVAPELAAGRQQALADALERRQRQKLALPPASGEEGVPRVETRLPGVSVEDSLIYRREMYRTDI